MPEETLMNDSNLKNRLLSPRELKMNSVVPTWGKKNLQDYEKLGTTWLMQFFFPTLHSYRKSCLNICFCIFLLFNVFVWACDQKHSKLSSFLPLTCMEKRLIPLALTAPIFMASCSTRIPIFFSIFSSNCFQGHISFCTDNLLEIFQNILLQYCHIAENP